MPKKRTTRQQPKQTTTDVVLHGEVSLKPSRRAPRPVDVTILRRELLQTRAQLIQTQAALASGMISANERVPMQNTQNRLEELKQERGRLVVRVQVGTSAANMQRSLEADLAAAEGRMRNAEQVMSKTVAQIELAKDRTLQVLNRRYQQTTNEQVRRSLEAQANDIRARARQSREEAISSAQSERSLALSTINRLNPQIATIVNQITTGNSAARELQVVNLEIARLEKGLLPNSTPTTVPLVNPRRPRVMKPRRSSRRRV